MQLVSGGMFSSGKGRHTGWTWLPFAISATVTVNRPLRQTERPLIVAIRNEAYRTECADPTQSGLCHSSTAKRNGTSRARRRPWREGPALLRRGPSDRTLRPPLSRRWETPFTKEEKGIFIRYGKRHMQRKGWATVWTSILWEWCKAVRCCHYPAVSQDGPTTEVRTPGLQGNLDMKERILIESHRFYIFTEIFKGTRLAGKKVSGRSVCSYDFMISLCIQIIGNHERYPLICGAPFWKPRRGQSSSRFSGAGPVALACCFCRCVRLRWRDLSVHDVWSQKQFQVTACRSFVSGFLFKGSVQCCPNAELYQHLQYEMCYTILWSVDLMYSVNNGILCCVLNVVSSFFVIIGRLSMQQCAVMRGAQSFRCAEIRMNEIKNRRDATSTTGCTKLQTGFCAINRESIRWICPIRTCLL